MNTSRLATIFACALLLISCATTGKLQAPRLTIVAANMVAADVFSQQFLVRLHVQNPNARPLPIKKINYKLWLEGDSFADGESTAAFVVPANGEIEFDLGVNTNFMSSIGRLLAHLAGTNRREIQYNFEGTVVVDIGFSPKIKFAERGMVDLSKR